MRNAKITLRCIKAGHDQFIYNMVIQCFVLMFSLYIYIYIYRLIYISLLWNSIAIFINNIIIYIYNIQGGLNLES